MKDSRNFRTLVAGVVMVAVFGTVLVQRIVEWGKGLTGDFIVYGQTGGPNPPQAVYTKAIPEFTVGTINNTTYSSNAQVVNAASTAVTVSASCYNGDGTSFSAPATATVSPPNNNGITFTGNLPNTNLPGKSILAIVANPATGPTPPPAITGWCLITSSGIVTVSARIDSVDSTTGNLISRTGVQPSPPDMLHFVIPTSLVVSPDQAGGFLNPIYTRDVAIAVMNTDSTPAVLNATMFNSAGIILGTQSFTMGPHVRLLGFVSELFDLDGTFSGASYVEFFSNSAVFAATALLVQGQTAATVTVDKVQ
jgi:hypothetical protein